MLEFLAVFFISNYFNFYIDFAFFLCYNRKKLKGGFKK